MESGAARWSLGGDGMCGHRVFVLRAGGSAAPAGHPAAVEGTTEGGCHGWVPQAALGGAGSSFPSSPLPEQLPALRGSVQPKPPAEAGGDLWEWHKPGVTKLGSIRPCAAVVARRCAHLAPVKPSPLRDPSVPPCPRRAAAAAGAGDGGHGTGDAPFSCRARIRGHGGVRRVPRVGCLGARERMSPGDQLWFHCEVQTERGAAEGCTAGGLIPVSWLRCSVIPARGSSPTSRWMLPSPGIRHGTGSKPWPRVGRGCFLSTLHSQLGRCSGRGSASSLPSHGDSAPSEPLESSEPPAAAALCLQPLTNG